MPNKRRKIWRKIRRPLITGILLLIFYSLQCTLFSTLSLGNIKPDLLMILTAGTGIMRGRKEGLLTGFFSGLLVDIQFGALLGFYALIYMVIGYLNGFLKHLFFYEEIKLPVISIGISEFLYGILIYIFRFLLNSEFQFLYYLKHIILPQVIYTTIAAFLLYPLMRKINRRLEAEEKRSASTFV